MGHNQEFNFVWRMPYKMPLIMADLSGLASRGQKVNMTAYEKS